jgi:hypothetical protein
MQTLLGQGCDLGQGYLFAKPMTTQELMAMVTVARNAKASPTKADEPAKPAAPAAPAKPAAATKPAAAVSPPR